MRGKDAVYGCGHLIPGSCDHIQIYGRCAKADTDQVMDAGFKQSVPFEVISFLRNE